MPSTPYVPNIIEALQRRTAYQSAQVAPDGKLFRDANGEPVVRKRTYKLLPPPSRGKHAAPVVFVEVYPPAPKPSHAKILEMLA